MSNKADISPRSTCIFEDSKGRLWFGTESHYYLDSVTGVVPCVISAGLYYIENGEVHGINLHELGIRLENGVLSKNRINAITEYNGKIVVASSQGLIIGDLNSWQLYNKENSELTNENIFALGSDEWGNLWMSHFPEIGVTKWNGEQGWTFYDKDSGLKGSFVKSIGTYEGVLYCGAQNRIYDFKGGVFIEHRKGLFGLGGTQLFGTVYDIDTNHIGVYFGAGPVITYFESFEMKSERVDRTSFSFSPVAFDVNSEKVLVASSPIAGSEVSGNSYPGIAVFSADLKELIYELPFQGPLIDSLSAKEKRDNTIAERKNPGIQISDALIDQQGNYWIATSSGLILHNPDGIKY